MVKSIDHIEDNINCALEIIRCYFYPDKELREKWWSEDYGGKPNAEKALLLIKEQLCNGTKINQTSKTIN